MEKEIPADLNQAASRVYQYNRVHFWLNGEPRSAEIPPAQTTLEFLQQTQQLWGTKCSCNEGDCGACTVVIAQIREGRVVYEAVNSCLYNAVKLQGKHLVTIEALGSPESLHPIQQAMLDFHATQCGYCSPGFVMSMFALFATQLKPDRETILAALEGNLCRCTGYDSILKAAEHLAASCTPENIVPDWCREVEAKLLAGCQNPEYAGKKGVRLRHCDKYLYPASMEELTCLMSEHPGHTLINGGTDIMVQMNVQRRQFPVLIDISGVAGLDRIVEESNAVCIGANVTYTALQESALLRQRIPALGELIAQIASRQIRNFATLAGNIANASPIGDTLPLLLVLDVSLLIHSANGERLLPLREFFLGYRRTALREGDFIRAVRLPLPPPEDFIRVEKSAKRQAVDISSVVSAVRIIDEGSVIRYAELALGGVAPVPMLSRQFHNAMANMELQGLYPVAIADFVAAEFAPISDVRGSENYRSTLIRNHVMRYLEDYLAGRNA